jgi:hypothetical protein
VRRATFVLAVGGIGVVLGVALATSLLYPYRTRLAPTPPAVHTLDVWGIAIRREPASSFIDWINREVPQANAGGAIHDYRLKLVLVDNQGSIQVQWYMRTKGTSPAARSALGAGVIAYFKQVNLLLAAKSLRIDSGPFSDSPHTNKADDTIDWEQPLWITPIK